MFLAIDEGIIDHTKGFYVNKLTGETLPISVAIEKGLIFTELNDQQPRRFVKTLIIEQVMDTATNQRFGITEAIQRGLINTNVTSYYNTNRQQQISIPDAYEQGYISGRLVDQTPSSFLTDQRHQTSYQINRIIDERTNQIFNVSDGKSILFLFVHYLTSWSSFHLFSY